MAISNTQRIAMAVIVLVGLLGGGAVLLSERATPGGEEATHADAGDSGREQHADDGRAAPKEGAKDERGHQAEAGATGGHNEGDREEHAERQVKLTEDQRKASGITVQAAGPAQLRTAARFQGEIRFNEDRTAHVVPRLAGVAESVNADLGQLVRKGQVLAVVASTSLAEQRSELLTAQKRRDLARSTHEREKKLWEDKISAQQDYQQAQSALQEAEIAVQNASQKLAAVGATGASTGLNRLDIRAPFAGTVVEKHLSLGEAVKEDASIFTVSDLSTVWAEFAVAPKDLATVRVGQRVVVSSTAFDSTVEGDIAYVGALLGEQTRTARARVTVSNPKGAWRPGLFVTVAVLGEDQQVPLTVVAEAVQTIDAQPMLFMAAPGGFVAKPVQVGRSDGRTVEILSGVRPGDSYAATNTFILKAELGKAGAEHGH